MTLEEKRAIKAAQDGWLPQKQAELKDLCKGDVTLSINWASFEGDLQGINWLEFNGPQQVCNAFRVTGADDLGREAIRSLNTIVVTNVARAEQKNLSLSDGVLTLIGAFAKSPGGRFSDYEIAEFLIKNLSLGEKREMKEATERLSKRQAELKEVCGCDVPYSMDWASFAGDTNGLKWLEANGPEEVSRAFRTIGRDDLGREALRGVKKVVVKNVPEVKQKELSFSDGVLTLTCAFSQSPDGRFASGEIAECLLKSL
jgi:hypothetical protein